MENQIDKKTIILLLLIIVLFLAAGFFFFFQKRTSEQQLTGQTENISLTAKNDLLNNKLPANFPSDFPMEDIKELKQNYQSVSPQGTLQSTRVMTTALTPAQALLTYTKFFEEKDWVRNQSGALLSPVLLRNKNLTLMIVATINKDTKDTTLEVTINQ